MSKVKDAYKEIENVIGTDYITDKDFMKAAYSRNVDAAFPDRWADIIVRPETTEEVSEIVKIANKYKIHMVPRGGGADLVGGSATQGGILLDLTRMNKILAVNKDDYYIIVECGITWGDLVSQLHPTGYTTGVIGPGSGYAATIGGGLSNSTAGGGSTKYGLVPDICLGVEVVLPNPQGTIIKTGAAANKYAKPFCRYGVAPDFTGLFMGDVGTMGIKTKAYLRIWPDPPFKATKSYILNNSDYNNVFIIAHKIRNDIGEGLRDLMVLPQILVQMTAGDLRTAEGKKIRIKGPLFMITLEATDQRILDVHLEKLEEIMTKDNITTPLPQAPASVEGPPVLNYNLKSNFHFFQGSISPSPSKISMVTCHKIPISHMGEIYKKVIDFDIKYKDEFPAENILPPGTFATMQYFLPNGNFVVLGGFTGDNVDEKRKKNMEMWHKKTRYQVRYGAVHYWLGESISQSIVEADAYTPEFRQFFKDMKRAVDPNFLLSPNKFHMYSYEDDITKYIVKDED
ncbi:MAG: FAD-binding oxidoreductase [Candidatus Hodarchaeota archaeon]